MPAEAPIRHSKKQDKAVSRGVSARAAALDAAAAARARGERLAPALVSGLAGGLARAVQCENTVVWSGYIREGAPTPAAGLQMKLHAKRMQSAKGWRA